MQVDSPVLRPLSLASTPSKSPRRARDSITLPSPARPPLPAGNGANDIFSLTDVILAEKYQFIEEIGYGNWGSVWKCHPKTSRDPEARVAVKLVHRSKNPTSSARVRSLWTEFKCIRALRPHTHPNVIHFMSFVITPSYALITMDHHPRLMPVELPELTAKNYFRQLVDAVAFLHRHGCIHNDIKPANILLSASDRPILVDFGFAQQYSLTSTDQFLSNLSWGTPEYLSPERARGILHDERLSDIWALGVTMYEIVVGRTPFEKTDSEEFLTRDALEVYYHRTTTGEFFGEYTITPEFHSLIRQMVEPNVHSRIQSCSKALRHRFFDPPLPSKSPALESFAMNTTPPPRALSQPSTPASRRKSGVTKLVKTDEKKKGIKVYRDSDTEISPTLARTSTRPTSTPLRILAENQNSPAPSLKKASSSLKLKTPPQPKATPSRIPVRKIDISSPGPLHCPLTMLVMERETVLAKEEEGKASPGKVVQKMSVSASKAQGASEDTLELLTAATRNVVEENKRASKPFTPRSNPSTPIGMSFSSQALRPLSTAPSPPPSPPFSSLAFAPVNPLFKDTGCPDTSFVRKSSLASKIKKLSLHRAPSPLSFNGIKGSFAHGGRRRASTMGMPQGALVRESEDHDAVTMPLSFANVAQMEDDQALDMNGDKARLESFSKHIQSIIDTKARSSSDVPNRSVVFEASQGSPRGTSKMAIRAPYEVQESREQPPHDLEAETGKQALSNEHFSAGPGAVRFVSPSNSTHASVSPAVASTAVKVRPSLTPSFVGSGSPTRPSFSTEERAAFSSATSISSIASSAAPGEDDEDMTRTFKPGHRRIPTAIRTVPSILLTESEDEESVYSRAETPFDERVASPPPTARVMEPGRSLPTWVPDEVSDPEDDADVDEPTLVISPKPALTKLLERRRSRTSSRNVIGGGPSISSSPTSGGGPLQQFVHVERSRHVVISDEAELQHRYHLRQQQQGQEDDEQRRAASRASSRATNFSRKRSIVSFFRGGRSDAMSSTAGSRPGTPSAASLSSVSQVSINGSEGVAKREGKVRRALRRLF